VQARLARSHADAKERAELTVLTEQMTALDTERSGLLAQQDALVVRSPVSGILIEQDRDVQPGRYVSPQQRLAVVASMSSTSARAYALSEAASRLTPAAQAVFIPEDATGTRYPLRLEAKSAAAAVTIEPAALAASLGGDVPGLPDKSGRIAPSVAAFLLTFSAGYPPASLSLRGTVHVEAVPESLASRAVRRAVSIIVRESGV
jgi:hypothetical protein